LDEDGLEESARVLQQSHRVLSNRGNLFYYLSASSVIEVRFLIRQIFEDGPIYEYLCAGSPLPSNLSGGREDVILHCPVSSSSIQNDLRQPASDETKAMFHREDQRGKYRAVDLTAPVTSPSNVFTIRGHKPPEGRGWRFNRDKIERLLEEEKIDFSRPGRPRLKHYLPERNVLIGSDWTDIPFPTSRSSASEDLIPVALLQRAIEKGSDTGDLIVEPYCRPGVPLAEAARISIREWVGCTIEQFSNRVTQDLNIVSADHEYQARSIDALSTLKAHTEYGEFALNTAEVAEIREERDQLRQKLSFLSSAVRKVRSRLQELNIGDEEIISVLEALNDSLDMEGGVMEQYAHRVQSWVQDWDILENVTQKFLPSAEFLLDVLPENESADFAPFIIQYCRALENEILSKVFAAYTGSFSEREGMSDAAVEQDLQKEKVHEKAGRFLKALKRRKPKLTLGEMVWVSRLLKPNGSTLSQSRVLQDFASFVDEYFSERLKEKEYLNQIDTIRSDFRNQAAHAHVMSRKVAQECRSAVRSCLNEFILSYKPRQVRNG